MTPLLQALVIELESYQPSLKPNRATIPIANDCYEAADDWRHLGRRVLENDTRVNYPERARGERMLLAELQKIVEGKSLDEQRKYAPVLRAGGELIEIVGSVQPPTDGHLGFLRIVRALFSFLRADFHFNEMGTEPTSIRFSSGAVYLELGLAMDPWMSCSFGIESQKPHNFWIHDLLYLNHDERYRTLPERLMLNSEAEIEKWFGFLAEVFRQYGSPVLENRPGAFDALTAAQAERDAAYAREMELKYGSQGAS
jgi:hypothetical protein